MLKVEFQSSTLGLSRAGTWAQKVCSSSQSRVALSQM